MGPTSEKQMAHLCEQWLVARERFLTRCGDDVLDAFSKANNRLFAAFAADWQGSDSTLLCLAFEQFRAHLIENYELGNPAMPEADLPWVSMRLKS